MQLPAAIRHPRGARAAAAWLALALILAPGAGRGAGTALPQQFAASYVLSAQGLDIGETRWTLEPIGDGRFEYHSRSETIGLARLLRDETVEERSVWRFADGGSVQPLRYTYSRTGKRERDVKVDFDWQQGRVFNTLNGHTWSMPLEAGMLDKLVYLLALMNDLAHDVHEARYAVADGGKVKTYLMSVVDSERVDTVLGPLDAVVVQRLREDEERVTLIWCAPALGYLPVLVEHREQGEQVRLTLRRLDGMSPGRW